MLTEQTHIEPNWAILPGTILEGGYELQELISADLDQARFKVRVLGDRSIDSYATFFRMSGGAADEQVAAWELLRSARHPNLSTPLGAARSDLEGTSAVYVILRRADETLSGVLAERALSLDEAGETLKSIGRALDYLEQQGLVHGAVSPEQVLAVGDSIQLSAEWIRKAGEKRQTLPRARYLAPESAGENETAAADVWCLGATGYEALTGRACDDRCREEARTLPEPFATVVLKCLESDPAERCSAVEIPALFKGQPRAAVVMIAPLEAPVAEPELAESPVQARAAAAGAGTMVSTTVSMPMSVPAPVPKREEIRAKITQVRLGSAEFGEELKTEAPPVQAPVMAQQPLFNAGAPAELRRVSARRGFMDEPEPRASLPWTYLAAGFAILLLIVTWAVWPTHHAPVPPSERVETNAATPQSAAPPRSAASLGSKTGESKAGTVPSGGKAWETRTLLPPAASIAATTGAVSKRESATKSKSKAAEGPLVNGTVWRVVAYTFNRAEDAGRKARSVNAKHPHVEAQVFSPSGKGGPYLVTVGGRMSREDAVRFRRKAVGMGLSRDSYVQNYKQ